jgi:hypothetical protein
MAQKWLDDLYRSQGGFEGAKRNYQAREDQSTLNQFTGAAKKALPELYQPAYSEISKQFNPQFRRARAYLASNPAAANSGVANRLDRVLQSQAFGALGESMGRTSAGVAGRGLDLFDQLLRRRQEERYKQAEEKRNRGGAGGAIGGIVGYGAKRAVDKFLPI